MSEFGTPRRRAGSGFVTQTAGLSRQFTEAEERIHEASDSLSLGDVKLKIEDNLDSGARLRALEEAIQFNSNLRNYVETERQAAYAQSGRLALMDKVEAENNELAKGALLFEQILSNPDIDHKDIAADFYRNNTDLINSQIVKDSYANAIAFKVSPEQKAIEEANKTAELFNAKSNALRAKANYDLSGDVIATFSNKALADRGRSEVDLAVVDAEVENKDLIASTRANEIAIQDNKILSLRRLSDMMRSFDDETLEASVAAMRAQNQKTLAEAKTTNTIANVEADPAYQQSLRMIKEMEMEIGVRKTRGAVKALRGDNRMESLAAMRPFAGITPDEDRIVARSDFADYLDESGMPHELFTRIESEENRKKVYNYLAGFSGKSKSEQEKVMDLVETVLLGVLEDFDVQVADASRARKDDEVDLAIAESFDSFQNESFSEKISIAKARTEVRNQFIQVRNAIRNEYRDPEVKAFVDARFGDITKKNGFIDSVTYVEEVRRIRNSSDYDDEKKESMIENLVKSEENSLDFNSVIDSSRRVAIQASEEIRAYSREENPEKRMYMLLKYSGAPKYESDGVTYYERNANYYGPEGIASSTGRSEPRDDRGSGAIDAPSSSPGIRAPIIAR